MNGRVGVATEVNVYGSKLWKSCVMVDRIWSGMSLSASFIHVVALVFVCQSRLMVNNGLEDMATSATNASSSVATSSVDTQPTTATVASDADADMLTFALRVAFNC